MALAPSERHLEDWVAKCGLNGVLADWVNMKANDLPPEWLIGRQFPVVSGYIDLMFATEYTLEIVELKKDALKADALQQVLRYIAHIEATYEDVARHMTSPLNYELHYKRIEKVVRGTLIGRSIDERTAIACFGAGIDVYTYDFIDGNYRFEMCLDGVTEAEKDNNLHNTLTQIYKNCAKRIGYEVHDYFIARPEPMPEWF